jgi:ribosomal peptide maturation radical SAM protein 1
MRIVLVHMPWGMLDVPSLALGVMRTTAERLGHQVEVRYANLDFVDWVVAKTDFGAGDYRYFSEETYHKGAGDWVFTSALYDDRRDGANTAYPTFLAGTGACPDAVAMTRTLHRIVPEFVTRLAGELAELAPDVVGFTSTFQQNTASLAAARLLKQRLPRVRMIMGGANCDGPQGAVLHRNFPFLDYVVRGEGEVAFTLLLEALEAGAPDLSSIAGLCWRDSDGRHVANPMSRTPLPPSAIVSPNFDGYLERIDSSVVAGWVEPRLVVEGSRGCWWGEKHHCTFCGLNGSFMRYRGKPPETFLNEVLGLAKRHQVLDFVVVDNIIDMHYFNTVLPTLADLDYDLRLHFEVKSNLRRHQFQQLSDAGMVQVQPGVESLSTHVLKLMDKGVNGCQNVRTLRDSQSTGVTVSWNYLYGFPGETDDDYLSIMRQFPALQHLEPPSEAARIAIERFSPYFDRPELGFDTLSPAPQYPIIYDLPDEELADLAYLFSGPVKGIERQLANELSDAVGTWRAVYPRSRLTWTDLGEKIVLVNTRPAFAWSTHELTTAAERTMFGLLDQPRKVATLAAQVPGGAAAVAPLLREWTELGLLFTDDDRYVQVAVESRNQMVMRVRHRDSLRKEVSHA